MAILCLIGQPINIVTAVAATGAKTAFALPARAVSIGWQTSYGTVPGAVDVRLEVSMDELGPFTQIDASTDVNGEFRTVAAISSARFIRARVVTNTGAVLITVQVICKVARP